MKYFLLCFIVITGCQKENHDKINDITVQDFLGDYCGDLTSPGSWQPFNTSILKSDHSGNKIIFQHFPGKDSIEAFIIGNQIIIPVQKFQMPGYNAVLGHSEYFDATISGNGSLDVTIYFMRINYKLRVMSDGALVESKDILLEMYNASKYSYMGTFIGDSATVTIESVNDSLVASITFKEDWIPFGWQKINIADCGCSLCVSSDSINDIATGEYYKLSGSGRKRGNRLDFSLSAYYHGISPLYFYNFSVVKTE
jgi:hypothetical protein